MADRHIFEIQKIRMIETTRMDVMRKTRYRMLLLLILGLGLTGCKVENGKQGGERTDIDFTVVEAQKIPEELAAIIEENRDREIRMAYRSGDELYLVRGYGRQDTGGCSISVTECTEDETSIWLATRLIGPQGADEISDASSCPCLVVKIGAREKEIRIE